MRALLPAAMCAGVQACRRARTRSRRSPEARQHGRATVRGTRRPRPALTPGAGATQGPSSRRGKPGARPHARGRGPRAGPLPSAPPRRERRGRSTALPHCGADALTHARAFPRTSRAVGRTGRRMRQGGPRNRAQTRFRGLVSVVADLPLTRAGRRPAAQGAKPSGDAGAAVSALPAQGRDVWGRGPRKGDRDER